MIHRAPCWLAQTIHHRPGPTARLSSLFEQHQHILQQGPTAPIATRASDYRFDPSDSLHIRKSSRPVHQLQLIRPHPYVTISDSVDRSSDSLKSQDDSPRSSPIAPPSALAAVSSLPLSTSGLPFQPIRSSAAKQLLLVIPSRHPLISIALQ